MEIASRPARRRQGENQRALSQTGKLFRARRLIVADCSFISLTKILPPAVPLLKPDGKIVALIKPQFEAGKAEVDKGRGVITDAPSTSACWRN